MVKTPRTRHSKATREPLTIDLQPEDAVRAGHEQPPTVFDVAESEIASEAGSFDAGKDPYAEPLGSTTDAPGETIAPTQNPATGDLPAEGIHASKPGHEPDDESYGFDDPQSSPSKPARDAGFSPPPVAPRRGTWAFVGAGLAGGIIALLAAVLLQLSDLMGGASGSADLRADIDGLRQQVEAIRSEGGGEIAGQVEGLAASVDAIRADLTEVKDAVAAAGGGAGGALQTLDERLKQVETVVAGLNQQPGGVNPDEVTAIGERIAGIEALVRAASESTSAAETRLTAIEQAMTALGARVDSQAQQPKIALAIATAALKAAIDRGAPFLAELETFAATAPNASEVAALRPFAETGVATREALLAESEATVAAMIAAANPVDPGAGFLDRLLHSAGALVTVQPIGEVEGTGIPQIAARMRGALQAGDLARAVSEYETLPEPAKGVGAGFAAKLKARLDAERLVDQAIANAMKA